MTMHDDALAQAGQFRERVPHRDERLLRRALDRALAGRRQRRRMGFVAIDGKDERHVLCSKGNGAVPWRHQAGALKS